MQEQNQRTSPWLIAWRVIFTFALIGCIVFIFSNSLQIADVSEGASGRVLGILQGILRHLGLPGAADRLTMHIVRKLAHFCEYLLEGFLLMLCLRVYTRHFFKHVSWPMLGGLLTALTDETIQLFVPGRSGQVTDIWIDFSGVMTGLLAGLILLGCEVLYYSARPGACRCDFGSVMLCLLMMGGCFGVSTLMLLAQMLGRGCTIHL